MSLAPLGLAPTGSLAPDASPIARTGLRLDTPLPADLAVSFEFFPPKTEKMEQTLWQAVHKLAPLQPEFVSVTYGAGGSTRERTHSTVCRLQKETGLRAAAHLTCVGATREEIDAIARAMGQRHPPHRGAARRSAEGCRHRIRAVSGRLRLCRRSGRRPEACRRFRDQRGGLSGKPPPGDQSASRLDNLKRKIDAGATRAISQYFFDSEAYLRFVDRGPLLPALRCRSCRASYRSPTSPALSEFSASCGASVPPWMAELFSGLDADPDTRHLVAATSLWNSAASSMRKASRTSTSTRSTGRN